MASPGRDAAVNPPPKPLACSVVYASSEDERYPAAELNRANGNRGWQSSRLTEYPQEIGFRFDGEVALNQLQLVAHQSKTPTRIDIYVYSADQNHVGGGGGIPVPGYHEARFSRLGFLSFANNEKAKYKSRERKNVHLNTKALYVKLVIYQCWTNNVNLYNQVGLVSVSALGEFLHPVAFPSHAVGGGGGGVGGVGVGGEPDPPSSRNGGESQPQAAFPAPQQHLPPGYRGEGGAGGGYIVAPSPYGADAGGVPYYPMAAAGAIVMPDGRGYEVRPAASALPPVRKGAGGRGASEEPPVSWGYPSAPNPPLGAPPAGPGPRRESLPPISGDGGRGAGGGGGAQSAPPAITKGKAAVGPKGALKKKKVVAPSAGSPRGPASDAMEGGGGYLPPIDVARNNYDPYPPAGGPHRAMHMDPLPPLPNAGGNYAAAAPPPPPGGPSVLYNYRSPALLQFENYYVQQTKDLSLRKAHDISVEDFDGAKRCKVAMDTLQLYAERIYDLESIKVQKMIEEAFLECQQIKVQMDELIREALYGPAPPPVRLGDAGQEGGNYMDGGGADGGADGYYGGDADGDAGYAPQPPNSGGPTARKGGKKGGKKRLNDEPTSPDAGGGGGGGGGGGYSINGGALGPGALKPKKHAFEEQPVVSKYAQMMAEQAKLKQKQKATADDGGDAEGTEKGDGEDNDVTEGLAEEGGSAPPSARGQASEAESDRSSNAKGGGKKIRAKKGAAGGKGAVGKVASTKTSDNDDDDAAEAPTPPPEPEDVDEEREDDGTEEEDDNDRKKPGGGKKKPTAKKSAADAYPNANYPTDAADGGAAGLFDVVSATGFDVEKMNDRERDIYYAIHDECGEDGQTPPAEPVGHMEGVTDFLSHFGPYCTACLFSKRFKLREAALKVITSFFGHYFCHHHGSGLNSISSQVAGTTSATANSSGAAPGASGSGATGGNAAAVSTMNTLLKYLDMKGYGLLDPIVNVYFASCEILVRLVEGRFEDCPLAAVQAHVVILVPRILLRASDATAKTRDEALSLLFLLSASSIGPERMALCMLTDPVDHNKRRIPWSNHRVATARLTVMHHLLSQHRLGGAGGGGGGGRPISIEALMTKLLIPSLNSSSNDVRDLAVAVIGCLDPSRGPELARCLHMVTNPNTRGVIEEKLSLPPTAVNGGGGGATAASAPAKEAAAAGGGNNERSKEPNDVDPTKPEKGLPARKTRGNSTAAPSGASPGKS